MQKAHTLGDIDGAISKFQPVTPNHPFYVNFDNVRGDFQEQELMSMLNVRMHDGRYRFDYRANQSNQTILFLAGMRGFGKTSELAKYALRLHCQLARKVVLRQFWCELTDTDGKPKIAGLRHCENTRIVLLIRLQGDALDFHVSNTYTGITP